MLVPSEKIGHILVTCVATVNFGRCRFDSFAFATSCVLRSPSPSFLWGCVMMSKRGRARVDSATYDGPTVLVKKPRVRARVVTDGTTPLSLSSGSRKPSQAACHVGRLQALQRTNTGARGPAPLTSPSREVDVIQPPLIGSAAMENALGSTNVVTGGGFEGDSAPYDEVDPIINVVDEYWKVLQSMDLLYRLDTSTYVFQDWDEEEHSLQVCESILVCFCCVDEWYCTRLAAIITSHICRKARQNSPSTALVQLRNFMVAAFMSRSC